MKINLKIILYICFLLIPCIGFCVPSAVEQIKAMPGLVALWVFDEPAGTNRVSEGNVPYELVEMNGTHDWGKPIYGVSTGSVDRVGEGPLSGYSAEFDAGQYLMLSNSIAGDLDIYGADAEVSIVAYIKREPRYEYQRMQFIAGMWDESVQARQYGLILDVPVGDPQRGLVYPHISINGGRSDPDVAMHVDVAANVTPVSYGRWQSVGMTYDGTYIKSYLDGVFEPRSDGSYYGGPANPYYCPDGIGRHGADFTIAGHGVGGPGMYGTFVGKMGGVAVFNRALSDTEMLSLHSLGDYEQPPIYTKDSFGNDITTRLPMESGGWSCSIGDTAIDASSSTTDWWIVKGAGNGGTLGYAAKTSIGTRGIIWREAPSSLDLTTIHSIRFALHNARDADSIRIVVQVEGQWYVSTQYHAMAGVSSSDWRLTENEEFPWDSNGTAWALLNYIPGVELGIGDSLPSTNQLTGVVTAYGIYNEPNIGTLRIDDFSLHQIDPFVSPRVFISETFVDIDGDTHLDITFETFKGWNYQLQVSTDLLAWEDSGQVLVGDGVQHDFTAIGTGEQRFFRFLITEIE